MEGEFIGFLILLTVVSVSLFFSTILWTDIIVSFIVYIFKGIGWFFDKILWKKIIEGSAIWVYDNIIKPLWEIIKEYSVKIWNLIKSIWREFIKIIKSSLGIAEKVGKEIIDVSKSAYNSFLKPVLIKIYDICKVIIVTYIEIFIFVWKTIFEIVYQLAKWYIDYLIFVFDVLKIPFDLIKSIINLI